MTKDRIEQLQAKSGISKPSRAVCTLEIDEEETNEESSLTGNRIGKIVTTKFKEKQSLEVVFKHVNEIIALIESIKENVVLLKKHHVSIQHSSRLDKSAREQNERLNDDIKSTMNIILAKIKDLEPKKNGDPNSAVNRVISTQKSLLSKMFKDAADDYEKALVAHRKSCENIIKKELLIVIKKLKTKVECVPVDIHVSDEDLLNILDSEDSAVFVDNYMKETADARALLQDVSDRHKEVLNIEKNLTLVRDMFVQLGLQVIQQGELIDKIEYHVGNGLAYTNKGKRKLFKSHMATKKLRKKKLCLVICSTSVVGVLLILFILFLFI